MIKIYVADCSVLSDTAIFNTIYERVPNWRKARTGNIKRTKNACQSLCAGYLFDNALRDIQRTDLLETVEFTRQGKPYFVGEENLFFNLSHSGDMAMCVIADEPVGCDIQDMKKDSRKIADKFFSKAEREYIDAGEGEMDRNRRFYEVWTRKEAYTKLLGDGISHDFRSFNVFDLEFHFQNEIIDDYNLCVCTYRENNASYLTKCCIKDEL